MKNDIYLAGYADAKWRSEFKEKIAKDITIFDPFDDNYETLGSLDKAELVAKELENIENCEIIIFYMCKEWDSQYSMIQLGDAVGQGKQVIAHIEQGMPSEEKISRYCEYRGLITVNNMDDLVESAEEYLAQKEVAESLGL